MNNPQFLSLFSAVFLALAGYNLLTGFKRVRNARVHGVSIKWHKQINLLTGTEYLLLALVFMLSIEYKNPAIPKASRAYSFRYIYSSCWRRLCWLAWLFARVFSMRECYARKAGLRAFQRRKAMETARYAWSELRKMRC